MRLPMHVLLLLGLALIAALPAAVHAAPGAAPATAALQNQLIARSDGTLYLVRDGTRHLVTPTAMSDDDVAAIPEGTGYANGFVPTDALAALVNGSLFGPAAANPPTASAPVSTGSAQAASAPAASVPAPAALPSALRVTLNEWSISPDTTTVAAGKVSFDVSDAGKGEHEMVLFKTDKDPSGLTVSRGKVDESALGQKVGEVDALRSGDDKTAAFDLQPGKYILICNLVNHYSKGMVSQIEAK